MASFVIDDHFVSTQCWREEILLLLQGINHRWSSWEAPLLKRSDYLYGPDLCTVLSVLNNTYCVGTTPISDRTWNSNSKSCSTYLLYFDPDCRHTHRKSQREEVLVFTAHTCLTKLYHKNTVHCDSMTLLSHLQSIMLSSIAHVAWTKLKHEEDTCNTMPLLNVLLNLHPSPMCTMP